MYNYPRNKGRLRNLRCTLLTSSVAVSHFPQNNQMIAIAQLRANVKFISRSQTIPRSLIIAKGYTKKWCINKVAGDSSQNIIAHARCESMVGFNRYWLRDNERLCKMCGNGNGEDKIRAKQLPRLGMERTVGRI